MGLNEQSRLLGIFRSMNKIPWLTPIEDWTRIPSVTLFLSLACINVSATEPDLDFFERKVRPLLVEHCYECHSSEAGKSKGGLFLDARTGWQVGGDSGPAIVPHEPDSSLLIRAVRYGDPDLEMPPDGRLSTEQIRVLEEWVETGATDPRDGSIQKEASSIDLEKGRQFWSFQAPIASAPPAVQDTAWPKRDIDFFILSRLEAAGVQPNPPASDRELIRRIYFDLIGLPPTPEQLEQALNNPSETRISSVVDQLLASQHFGETWGRHWLDLARYSESTGGGRSALLPNAWRYRNYVIDAFNNDKAFDQFIREQIAGDLLPAESDKARADQLTATAFLVMGPKNLDLQDKELLRMNTVDEQIDTVTRVFMGLTVSCARCHDHKFDPIPAKDYYALAGIFRSTRTLKRSNVSTLTIRDLPTSAEHKQAVETYQKKKKHLDSAIKQQAKKASTKAEKEALNELKQELAALTDRQPAPLPKTLAVDDEETTEDYNLCVRGNVHQLGEKVPRGFLQVISQNSEHQPKIPEGQSGRLELANWLSSPNHPLTARVIVNRVWGHLFGEGLVRSVDNFGTQGDAPSHQALLDYLAVDFMQNGWSIKRLVRQLMLSRTYQLSSSLTPASANVDAENRLLWRMPRRRLTAEAVRDAMLSLSGTLQVKEVECLFPNAARNETALQKASIDIDQLVNPPLRSVYIPVLREEGLNPLLKAFDFANPSFPVGRRNRSILPTQALFLMNDEFVMQQASKAARLLQQQHPGLDTEQLIEKAYLSTLARHPNTEERRLALDYLKQVDAAQRHEAWAQVFHSLFASIDFRFLR